MRGYHYGDVAVKFLNMDHVEDEDRLEHFKAEVASFKVEQREMIMGDNEYSIKNTRHDNIVLCLGYCLDHSSLGIVMGLCKVDSLNGRGKTMNDV